MSSREKTTWLSLALFLFFFGSYYSFAFRTVLGNETSTDMLPVYFIITAVFVAIIQMLLHLIRSIAFNREPGKGEDERERLVELKATRMSYYVLVFGILVAILSNVSEASPLKTINILVFFFILAQIVGFSVQLFYYRRGIHYG